MLTQIRQYLLFVLLLCLSSVTVAAAESGAAPIASPAPTRPAAPAPKTFNIFEYQVEGNTKLQAVDIENAVYPFLGEAKTIQDVEGARQALERVFHAQGYLTALVNIPEQKVDNGVVRLKVIEAPIGKLRVVGSHYYSLGVIRDGVPELAEGNVPDFNEVQQELGDLNRSPERHVTPVLKASDTPGKVDVELQVKDELPLHASLEVNDHYSANTRHLRTIGSVSYDNLFQRSQSINFQYQQTPENVNNTQVFSLSYVAPLSGGSALAAYGVHSNSNIAAVGDLSVIGSGDVLGLRLIEPLAGGDSHFYHSVSAGFDYKDFKQDVVLQGSDSIPSPIHYVPFSLQYSATWLQAPGKGSEGPPNSTSLDAGFTFTLPGFGSNSEEFANKRAKANQSFLVFHPGLSHLQMLPAGWSLQTRLDGQLSSGPLVSNEEFTAGGAESVRGYVEGESLGDEGVHSSLELRTPGLLDRYNSRIEKSYLLAFTEGANLRVREAGTGQQSHFSLASAGLGWRFKAYGLAMDLDYAHVLKDSSSTQSGDNRGLFKVIYGF